jgi:16S rRNA (cytosine1402-N4)-methyltransferase
MQQPIDDGAPHRPVLYQEIIHALQPNSHGYYVDSTLGAGGHAWGILQASAPGGRLLGLDVDPAALTIAKQRLAVFGDRAVLVRASYTSLQTQLEQLDWPAVHGIVLDLGASSMQFDTPERGFSFQVDAPLDMRFDPVNPHTAADLVNNLTEVELAQLLFKYGEEPKARQIAEAVCRRRPIHTTSQLAEIVSAVYARGRQRRHSSGKQIHPATLTFQALRIAVNRELEAIEQVLPDAIEALAAGGRLAVISFHSLEDRLVKQAFRRESQDCLCPPRQPVCTCGHVAVIKEINRRPVFAGNQETGQNPRARSARLRVVEKLPAGG